MKYCARFTAVEEDQRRFGEKDGFKRGIKKPL
jgi:hypothetical protein